MMFSATLSKDIRPVCKKFMQDPMEVYVDDEAKLTLHGLKQHYVKLKVRHSLYIRNTKIEHHFQPMGKN